MHPRCDRSTPPVGGSLQTHYGVAMPVKVECPHCRTMLAVPSKFLGGTASCPQCRGSFQVPASAGPKFSDSATPSPYPSAAYEPMPGEMTLAGSAVTVAAPSMAVPLGGGAAPVAAVPPAAAVVASPMSSPAAPLAAPVSPALRPAEASWLTHRAARFITGDSTRAAIQPTSDGRLPGLQLDESTQRKAPTIKVSSSSPAFIIILLVISGIASLSMVLLDFEPGASEADRRAQARFTIEHEYILPAQPPLPPYQIYLRRARQAHGVGDAEEEEFWYREVLMLLRAEGRSQFRGVTGTPERDRRLEELIAQVLD